MSAESDLAELSSLRAQLDDLRKRVEAIASRYHETPDSGVAAALFEAERAMLSGGRSLDRAIASLAELSSRGGKVARK